MVHVLFLLCVRKSMYYNSSLAQNQPTNKQETCHSTPRVIAPIVYLSLVLKYPGRMCGNQRGGQCGRWCDRKCVELVLVSP